MIVSTQSLTSSTLSGILTGLELTSRFSRILDSFVLPDVRCDEVGAGEIILITAGVDCGGTVDDARLDYEIVAWTSNGQSFSIGTGEIGTHSNNKKILNP